MRQLFMVLVLGALLLSVGCASVATPVMGIWYTDVKGPITATDHASGSKEGSAMATSILGLIAQGDASIATAAEKGGITKIQTVDHHSWSILGIYSKFTTTVTGE